MRRIGVLMGGAEHDLDWQRLETAFEEALRNCGWTPGRDLRIDYRWPGDDDDRMNAHAIEIVELGPEIIVTAGLYGVRAVRRRTDLIPIVFINLADPLGSGLVTDLAHPSGRVTGFGSFDSDICWHWLNVLKEFAPRPQRLGVVFNPDATSQLGSLLAALQKAAAASKIGVTTLPVRTDADVGRAIEAFARGPNGLLLMLPEPSIILLRTSIIEAANRAKLPALYPYRFCATGGGLLSFGIDVIAQCKGAAAYVDKILHGESPGNLVVQEANKFELVINLRTAKALGLTVPRTVATLATEIID